MDVLPVSRRKFIATTAQACLGSFLLRFAPAANMSSEMVIPVTQPLYKYLEAIINISMPRLNFASSAHNIIAQTSSSGDYQIETTDEIYRGYYYNKNYLERFRSEITNILPEVLDKVRLVRERYLLNALQTAHPGAQISHLQLDDKVIETLLESLAKINLRNAKTTTILYPGEIKPLVKLILTGEENEIAAQISKLILRSTKLIEQAELLVSQALPRDLMLRKLCGHEEPISLEEMSHQLGIEEGKIKELRPVARLFSRRSDAYLVTGINMVIDNNGTEILKPVENWIELLTHDDFQFHPLNIIGTEESCGSVLVRIEPGTCTDIYFKSFTAEKSAALRLR